MQKNISPKGFTFGFNPDITVLSKQKTNKGNKSQRKISKLIWKIIFVVLIALKI